MISYNYGSLFNDHSIHFVRYTGICVYVPIIHIELNYLAYIIKCHVLSIASEMSQYRIEV